MGKKYKTKKYEFIKINVKLNDIMQEKSENSAYIIYNIMMIL